MPAITWLAPVDEKSSCQSWAATSVPGKRLVHVKLRRKAIASIKRLKSKHEDTVLKLINPTQCWLEKATPRPTFTRPGAHTDRPSSLCACHTHITIAASKFLRHFNPPSCVSPSTADKALINHQQQTRHCRSSRQPASYATKTTHHALMALMPLPTTVWVA